MKTRDVGGESIVNHSPRRIEAASGDQLRGVSSIVQASVGVGMVALWGSPTGRRLLPTQFGSEGGLSFRLPEPTTFLPCRSATLSSSEEKPSDKCSASRVCSRALVRIRFGERGPFSPSARSAGGDSCSDRLRIFSFRGEPHQRGPRHWTLGFRLIASVIVRTVRAYHDGSGQTCDRRLRIFEIFPAPTRHDALPSETEQCRRAFAQSGTFCLNRYLSA